MRFEPLKQRVTRREQLLEGRLQQTRDQWQTLTTTWRESWTPLRIVVAGLVSGFLVGRARPLRVASGGGVLQLVSALSSLFAGSSAQAAANEAEQAADVAAHAAAVGPPIPVAAPVVTSFDSGLP